MNKIYSTWHEFFGQFDDKITGAKVAAYPMGFAWERDKAGDRFVAPRFPYITYPVVRPGFLQNTLISVHIFDKHEAQPGYLAKVAYIQGQMEELIGLGINLRVEGTNYRIAPGSPFFPTPLPEPNDSLVVHGIVNLLIRDRTF